MTLGVIFGIPIRVDYSWLLIASLLTASFAVGFGHSFPYLALTSRLMLGLSACLLLFGSVLAHELAHAVVALRHQVGIRSITLFVFGGAAEMLEEPREARAELTIAAAGPFMSLVLALAFWGFYGATLGTIPLPFLTVAERMAEMNLVLVLFNIIPGFPLDGGRVLRALLWGIWGDLTPATRVAGLVGSFFGAVIVALGLVTLFVSNNVIGGVWFVLIGLFLRRAARGSYQQLLVRRALEGVRARDLMLDDVPCVPPETRLSTVVDEIIARHDVQDVPVVDRGELVGMLSFEALQRLGRGELERTAAYEVMDREALADSVDPDEDAIRVLPLLSGRERRVPVVSDGVLLGVLTRDEVFRRLRLHLEMGAKLQ